MSSQNDRQEHPEKLSGLKQAMYILDCLHNGLTEEQIITKCDGDSPMVNTWIGFLKDLHWIVKDGDRWVVTDKGKQLMTKLTDGKFQSKRN